MAHRIFLGIVVFATVGCLNPMDGPTTVTGHASTTGHIATTDDGSTSEVAPDDTSGESTATPPESSSSGPASDSESTATSTGTGLCGDGHVDPDEECDLGLAGNDDDAACLNDCKLASCGDGHVFTGKEECDDQNTNPTDGCYTCYRTRKVFITSAVYQGADFMGLEGADQRCRSLAAQAGLVNSNKFKAWLSDSQTAARERLYHARGRYELVNGLLVAENWDALVAGQLMNPINVNEKSETLETAVFTSTNPDGSTAEGADHCADWTDQTSEDKAFWGASSEISVDWTLADSPANPGICNGMYALYCFEQE